MGEECQYKEVCHVHEEPQKKFDILISDYYKICDGKYFKSPKEACPMYEINEGIFKIINSQFGNINSEISKLVKKIDKSFEDLLK